MNLTTVICASLSYLAIYRDLQQHLGYHEGILERRDESRQSDIPVAVLQ